MESVGKKEQRESWKWPLNSPASPHLSPFLFYLYYFPISHDSPIPNTTLPLTFHNNPLSLSPHFSNRTGERKLWAVQWETVALAAVQRRFRGMTSLPLLRKGLALEGKHNAVCSSEKKRMPFFWFSSLFLWLKADRMEPGIIFKLLIFKNGKKMAKNGKNRDLILIYLALFFWPNWKPKNLSLVSCFFNNF